MNFEELPLKYREYAAERRWRPEDALNYWHQAAEYRVYIGKAIAELGEQEVASPEFNVVQRVAYSLLNRRLKVS